MSTVNEEAGITVFNGTGQKIEVLFQDEVQLDINVPLFYIKSGEEEIQAYVNNHAKPELDEYTAAKKQEITQHSDESLEKISDKTAADIEAAKNQIDGYVTGMANPAVQQYADETIKPQLESFVTEAENSATAATSSANAAAESELIAANRANDAQTAREEAETSSLNAYLSAEDARKWAVGTIEEQPAGSSEYWAGEAKTAAENADNGYELFQASWFDHKPESVSWLRADTFSWQDGDVYFAAYNELFAQYGAETSVEETNTVGSVSVACKRTPKGYKICAPDQANNIAALYENTGVAWYYILDTENKRFKLPRTKWSFVGCRDNAGNYVPETLPNITGTSYPGMHSTYGNIGTEPDVSALKTVKTNTWGVNNAGNNTEFQQAQINFNASRSSSAYQSGAAVQQRAVEMFLYFFAGNAVKSDTIIDTGQITEALNAKLDLDAVNLSQLGKSLLCGLGMPSERVIDLTLTGSNSSQFTAPANGYYSFYAFATAPGSAIALQNISNFLFTTVTAGNQGNPYLRCFLPVKKGQVVNAEYVSVNLSGYVFRFIYAEGENE